jgi:hypothetical protein
MPSRRRCFTCRCNIRIIAGILGMMLPWLLICPSPRTGSFACPVDLSLKRTCWATGFLLVGSHVTPLNWILCVPPSSALLYQFFVSLLSASLSCSFCSSSTVWSAGAATASCRPRLSVVHYSFFFFFFPVTVLAVNILRTRLPLPACNVPRSKLRIGRSSISITDIRFDVGYVGGWWLVGLFFFFNRQSIRDYC